MTAAPLPPQAVTVRAPAKVNLELRVGPRRPDGYHDLATVFQTMSLYDEVSVTRWDEWEVIASGPHAALFPDPMDNLVVRAAKLLAEHFDLEDTPLSFRIDKSIPVAGGMAGGSADAAAALVAVDHLFELGLDRSELDSFAAQLGADVPFALAGGTAMGTGRGDRLAPVLSRGTYHWVLAFSDVGLSTPDVFAELDRLREDRDGPDGAIDVPVPEVSAELMTALRSGDPAAVGASLGNDLQEAAFSLRPELREVHAAGLEFGALGAVVSGSGPTIAFLTADVESAMDLSVSLAASDVCRDVSRAKGPVHGAQIIAGPSAGTA